MPFVCKCNCLPGRPNHGTSVSPWVPEHTTTPQESCWQFCCPGLDAADAPVLDGAYWKSWMHSLVAGCGPSPSKRVSKKDRDVTLHILVEVTLKCLMFWWITERPPFQDCSYLHLWAAHWGTEYVSFQVTLRAAALVQLQGGSWKETKQLSIFLETNTQIRITFLTLTIFHVDTLKVSSFVLYTR